MGASARFAAVASGGRLPRPAWAAAALLLCVATADAAGPADPADAPAGVLPEVILIGVGDSLTHGTLDATNNWLNSLSGYLQRVASSLATQAPLRFRQPFYDVDETRIAPLRVPTNLGVDGADSFSVEGIEYGKRVGSAQNQLSLGLLAEQVAPAQLGDDYDKVLYPINVYAHQPVSQMGAAAWLLQTAAPAEGIGKALVVFWVGNNDSSGSALGLGGRNPQFFPLPLDAIAARIRPELRQLLELARALGLASFAPYTQAAVERNLTELSDFEAQFNRLLDRLALSAALSPADAKVLVLTLPYYSAVGYLMDSEDIEYYLRKLNPAYSVPAGFQRVAPDGEPVTDFFQGDRISLLTFGLLYTLLATGATPEEVNQVLEDDGLVLSQAEAAFVRARIDGFNQVIASAVAARGARFQLVDIGQFLNDALAGDTELVIDGRRLTRKWVRGGAFSLDGVHPGYTGHSVIANHLLEAINGEFGLAAPLYDLEQVFAADPYVDRDGDGWAPGPAYPGTGLNQLLFLFKDPDDAAAGVGAALPPDVWNVISDILLADLLGNAQVREEARRRGLAGVR